MEPVLGNQQNRSVLRALPAFAHQASVSSAEQPGRHQPAAKAIYIQILWFYWTNGCADTWVDGRDPAVIVQVHKQETGKSFLLFRASATETHDKQK